MGELASPKRFLKKLPSFSVLLRAPDLVIFSGGQINIPLFKTYGDSFLS